MSVFHATWRNLICCKKGLNVGGKTGNKNVQLRLALQHHWKTNWRRRCTFYHSRIKPFLKQIKFLHVAKGCCKKIELFFFKSFCNLRQPDLALIRGRLNAEHLFSTRSAVMLQNKLHIVSCPFFRSFSSLATNKFALGRWNTLHVQILL